MPLPLGFEQNKFLKPKLNFYNTPSFGLKKNK